MYGGNSLVVQGLGLHAFTTEGLNSIPGQGTKIPQAVQCGQNKIKFLWKHERSGIAKAILRKKNRGRGLMLPVFRQQYKAIVSYHQNVWYWHKKYTHRDQWNRIDNADINPCSINLWEKRQEYTMEKRQSLQQLVLRKLNSYM